MSSWTGIKVRHEDGRTGIISGDYEGFLHRSLTISVLDDYGHESKEKGTDTVQLNANGPDSGSPGWQWRPDHESDPESEDSWLPLGDFHEVAKAIGTKLTKTQRGVMKWLGGGWATEPGVGAAVMINGKRVCNFGTMKALLERGIVTADDFGCFRATALGHLAAKSLGT